jgi:hypothetical protein
LAGRRAKPKKRKARIYTEIAESTEYAEKKKKDGGVNPPLQRKMLGVVFTEY